MCYRYSVPGPDAVKKTLQVKIGTSFERKYYTGAFDHPKLPVITNEKPEQVDLFKWGLIPFWVKGQNAANQIRERTANARCETIFEKPSFRHLAGKKHCLVISDGFFEWRWYNNKNYPYYIRLKNHEPYAMAGLWDRWIDKTTDEEIYSYTIITTDANPLMAMIHNKKKRMPVILKKEDYKKWIDKDITKEQTMNLLGAYDQNEMEAYTISKLITSKGQNPNVPEVIKPFQYNTLEPLPSQSSLF
jgi:putative SOS response-associated peptidase YedK